MAWLWWPLSLLLLQGGCGDDAPPLDQLPLRDTLRADPAVVAALSPAAALRLAARLETARSGDPASDALDGAGDDPVGTLVARLDAARARRDADPLMVGAIDGGLARPVAGANPLVAASALPMMDGAPDVATAALETRALDGQAGRALRALLDASGAVRLRRVVGWPIGAVAVGDTAYVNAAWLVALAVRDDARNGDSDGGGGDAGAEPDGAASPAATATRDQAATASGGDAIAASNEGTAAAAAATATAAAASGSPSPADRAAAPLASDTGATPPGFNPDGGASPAPTPAPDPLATSDSCDSAGGACAGGDACAGASASSDDSCDGSTDDSDADSCSGSSDDGSSDACANSGGDDASNCQMSRGAARGGRCERRERREGRNTLACLLMPLAFLLPRRRR